MVSLIINQKHVTEAASAAQRIWRKKSEENAMHRAAVARGNSIVLEEEDSVGAKPVDVA